MGVYLKKPSVGFFLLYMLTPLLCRLKVSASGSLYMGWVYSQNMLIWSGLKSPDELN